MIASGSCGSVRILAELCLALEAATEAYSLTLQVQACFTSGRLCRTSLILLRMAPCFRPPFIPTRSVCACPLRCL